MDFFSQLISRLIAEGNRIDIATNEESSPVDTMYRDLGCKIYNIECTRSQFDKGNFKAVRQIENIVKNGNYEIVHCHTPIAAVCTRIACRNARKRGTRVIYTAHGFHFYKGAPLKNWIIYYPVEKLCSRWTDVLITINAEDYELAKRKMKAKRVEYVPGVGIDLEKFAPDMLSAEQKVSIRRSLGLVEDDKMLLSVGELIPRKNHESVIRALARLNDASIKYYICGRGELQQYLQELINNLNLTDSVKMLGFRRDISDLCQCADLFVFPSLQEGLPVALMEAIATKTPVICSNIRGNTDLVGDSPLFDPKDIESIRKKIQEYLITDHEKEVSENYCRLKNFDTVEVIKIMSGIYKM